jgi:glycosyltransferase involved in cell wall biosynthesis
MYGTGDELAGRGHQIGYLFAEDFRIAGPRPLRRLLLPIEIARMLKRRSRGRDACDLVELHEPLAGPSVWLRRNARLATPVVILSYGLEERGYRAELAYRRRKRLPISVKKRVAPRAMLVQARYAVRHCDHILCANSEDVHYLADRGVPRARISQHHAGVSSGFLQAAPEATGAPRDSILFVGSWVLRKGILDLISSATRMLRKHPSARLTIAGCGVGEQTVLEAFPADVRAALSVIPHLSSDQELIGLYRRHGTLVLPSYFEGHPLVMVEAAALGMTIVTTNVCGMRDFVDDRVNGLTTPVADPDAILERLEELRVNPRFAQELGRRARRTAESHTWAAAADKMETAYQRAADAAAG